MNHNRLPPEVIIKKIESITPVKPLLKTYLGYISRFYDIHHFNNWLNTALNNMTTGLKARNQIMYLIQKADIAIGFANVNTHLRFNNQGYAIAEFFIQKEYSEQGYGRMLAESVFNHFPGDWEVAVALENKSALAFWNRVLLSYTQNAFEIKNLPSFKGKGFVFNNKIPIPVPV